MLAERGDRARGMIRNPDQAGDLEAVGAEPVICDLEAVDDISEQVAGSDAVVFTAGAGPGSGPERKRTVDLGGALKLISACRADQHVALPDGQRDGGRAGRVLPAGDAPLHRGQARRRRDAARLRPRLHDRPPRSAHRRARRRPNRGRDAARQRRRGAARGRRRDAARGARRAPDRRADVRRRGGRGRDRRRRSPRWSRTATPDEPHPRTVRPPSRRAPAALDSGACDHSLA